MRRFLFAAIAAAAGAIAALLIREALSPSGGGGRLTQERVLAEAVNSYSDTGQFFVVASTVRPFTPLGYYLTHAEADSAVIQAAGSYRAFGPYRGPATHDPWQVLGITVRVRTAGAERDLHYDPRTVDAVFLSMSAVRKFMFPYYRSLYGSEVAESVVAVILPPGPPRPPTPPCHAMSVPCNAESLLPLPRGTH